MTGRVISSMSFVFIVALCFAYSYGITSFICVMLGGFTGNAIREAYIYFKKSE